MDGSVVTSSSKSRNDLSVRFASVRRQSVLLTETLTAEDQSIQTCIQASPSKWHLAHTSWFFETFLLKPFSTGYRVFNPSWHYLFNSYYNSAGAQYPREKRGLLSRPGLSEILKYRQYIDEQTLQLLGEDQQTRKPAIHDLCELGLHHEQQHQELILTDIKTVLGNNPLRPRYKTLPTSEQPVPPCRWLEFSPGLTETGALNNRFCFDNELPRHQVFLHPFKLASRPVINREYRQFIADGGYTNPEYWLSDGWNCVSNEGWDCPMYWESEDGDWYEYTLGGRRQVNDEAPVTHISYYEADAYARWAGYRLPSEAEWELAAAHQPIAGNLASSGYLQPMSATTSDSGILDRKPLQQIYGDVWEWTSSAYSPYPGYQAASGALGEYNGKFMCGQYVLRGGSCVTPSDHIRASYRNFFPPQERWQFSGIRLAGDLH